MNLPDVFQMRTLGLPGYTHKVKKNAHGDYEVQWARGFPQKVGIVPTCVWTEDQVRQNINQCSWYLIDDTPKAPVKQAEFTLPDEFYFVCPGSAGNYTYKAKITASAICVTWPEMLNPKEPIEYSVGPFTAMVKSGEWKIIDKPTLTPEQIRFNKEYNEQIRALESSIKLSQQSEEHQKRLQQQYQERINDLKAKIVEEF